MSDYSVIPVVRDGALADIAIVMDGKKRHLWGRRGVQAELALAESLGTGELPVLLGSGLGELALELAERGPVAVYDDQHPVLHVTQAKQHLAAHPNVLWLDAGVDDALGRIARWREENGGGRLRVLPIPLYLRQFPGVYCRLETELRTLSEDSSSGRSVWERLRTPRFSTETPRVILISSGYFLVREVRSAMQRLGWPFLELDPETFGADGEAYAQELLKIVAEFRPDVLLTVNHFGVDEGGGLFDLLERLRLPLASWFVDAPFLTLSLFANARSDWSYLFTFDKDNVAPLRDMAFPHAHWLPLATDPTVFRPKAHSSDIRRQVAFVGHSGARLVAGRLKIAHFPPVLLREYKALAEGFLDAPEGFASAYVRRVRPDLMPVIESLPAPGTGWFWSLITRQATRVYRRRCLVSLMEFSPVIAGDRWWHSSLREHEGRWQAHGTVDYYDELADFYAATAVNINVTDRQMPGALNQRVFDCPAAGGFLLTDRREQMMELFDTDRELAVYEGGEDIAEKVRWYLEHPAERQAVTARARRRILDEHTYERRLLTMAEVLRKTYR